MKRNLITSLSLAARATLVSAWDGCSRNADRCIIEVSDPVWEKLAEDYERKCEKLKPSHREREPWPVRPVGNVPAYSTASDGEDVSPEVLGELLELGLFASRNNRSGLLYGLTYKGALVCGLMARSN